MAILIFNDCFVQMCAKTLMHKAVFEFLRRFKKVALKIGNRAGLHFFKQSAFAFSPRPTNRKNCFSNLMKKRCPNCRLINFPHAPICARCRFDFIEVSGTAETVSLKSKILRRAVICAVVCLCTLLAFYLSMIFTSASLSGKERAQIEKSIQVLDEKGFSNEVFLLRRLTAFRGNDNWLNASTRLEDAYAATNFPFEIMTIYPEFFSETTDETERAAILLHEAQHLKGADERAAYEFVWRNRRRLGWTSGAYQNSLVWRSVRKQTKEYAPNLFVCAWTEYDDCTEEQAKTENISNEVRRRSSEDRNRKSEIER